MRSSFGETFRVPPGYLNTASIGIPPGRVVDAMTVMIRDWSTGTARPPGYDDPVAQARQAWAGLIGVPAERVAIGGGVSPLVASVAAGIPDGTRVLVVDNEFTSATFPFAAQHRRGITLTAVPPGELVSRVDGHDLVVVSVVQSADGTRADLDGLRAAAEAAGARVLLDATQAVGWQPLRLAWADWVVGGCYKWLLSPRGAAWLYVRPDAMEHTLPLAANWYAGEDPWQTVYGLPLRLAGDARAFDHSPAWFAHAGAAVALTWLAGLDLRAVHDHCVRLADATLTGLGLAPQRSAIISLDLPNASTRLGDAGVVASQRAGRTRLSFHLYNTEEDVDRTVTALR
jgi:selenocysteine lyase/cysteine desulfurase